jgi:hypothetical protein
MLRRSVPKQRLRDQHDLADVAPLREEAVGFGGAVEGDRGGDDGA